MVNDVTVVIPTIPPRWNLLQRALTSVVMQTHPVDAIAVVTDTQHNGSAVTRNRALQMARTEWVAFLDDDDEFMSNHIDELLQHATDDVDVVYTGCMVFGPDGSVIPPHEEWGRFGLPFNEDLLRAYSWLPVTSLCRTRMAQACGGFMPHSETVYDDWGFYVNMLDTGARFVHHPVKTWIWHHHGANTSGQGDRW